MNIGRAEVLRSIQAFVCGHCDEIKVTFHCERPGLLIGRKAWAIDAIKKHLEEKTKKKVSIHIVGTDPCAC